MADENDVVLIYFENEPAIFARIESVEPDSKRGWYHVTLLLLTIPMHTVTWILRDIYIDGAPFTMGGTSVRIEPVEKRKPAAGRRESPGSRKEPGPEGSATIIPFRKT